MSRKDVAEQMFNNALSAIKDSQSDLEKTISGYASGITGKPLVDIVDHGNYLVVKADLPGFSKENIKIDVGDDILEITAIFQEDELEEGASYVKKERRYTKVQRVIELPNKVKIDYTTASFENGILQVTLPKLGKTGVEVQ